MFKRALFIFRRDLRLDDNTGLIYALESAKEVICAFIFTPEQIYQNSYKSDHCLQFMLESLEDLEKELSINNGKLYYFFGKPEEIVSNCIQEQGVDLVVVNRDYTPYSFRRDQQIECVCNEKKICFQGFNDLLLNSPNDILSKSGVPYRVFTPYYKSALKNTIRQPVLNHHTNYFSKPISYDRNNLILKEILSVRKEIQKGGREYALKILKNVNQFCGYSKEKDFPALDKTTHLSPHLKFGTISSREAYLIFQDAFGKNSELIRSLYWRDFFSSISYHFPHVYNGAFYNKFDQLLWSNDERIFKKWTEGQTGFPIVDAGMRELKATGNMHNRVRMIVGSFLVKDLHIDWRKGEKHFANFLTDYDPAINNGNWQWIASTGCDAQPYFRIFNPWSQQAKFDPECEYIKKWIPELENEDSKTIHQWYKQEIVNTYPLPIVDHFTESKIALRKYMNVYGNT